MFTVTQKVENKTDKPVTLFPYGLISRHGLPHTDGLYILHEGPLGVFRDKAGDSGTLKDFSYKDIVSDKAVEFSSIGGWLGFTDRSEEHTSELQSLMRISYAVFCLKKQKQKKKYNHTQRYRTS